MDTDRRCVKCGAVGFVSHGALCPKCRHRLCRPKVTVGWGCRVC